MSHPNRTSMSSVASSELLNPDSVLSRTKSSLSTRSNRSTRSKVASPLINSSSAFDFIQTPEPAYNPASQSKMSSRRNTMEADKRKSTMSRRGTKQFDGQYGWDTPNAEDIRRLSPVLLELRTNVIVNDEYALVTELSKQVAKRYQRDESSIMISVHHSTCLMFGGTFDPAYFLTITAIEQHCLTTTNKRNAALMQSFLSDVLSVPLDRGVVRFNPIPEDCLATGGRTVAANVEKADAETGVKANTQYRRKSTRLSMYGPAQTGSRPASPVPSEAPQSKTKRKSSILSIRRKHDNYEVMDEKVPQVPSKEIKANTKTTRTKSNAQAPDENAIPFYTRQRRESRVTPSKKTFQNNSRPVTLTQNKTHYSDGNSEATTTFSIPPPPPIPDEKSTPRLNKRKSLVSLFRRDTYSNPVKA